MDDAWQLVDADGNDEKEQAVDASVLPEVCAEEPVPTMPNPVTVYHPASRLSHAASGVRRVTGHTRLTRLEKMFAVLLVWGALSIVWQSFMLPTPAAFAAFTPLASRKTQDTFQVLAESPASIPTNDLASNTAPSERTAPSASQSIQASASEKDSAGVRISPAALHVTPIDNPRGEPPSLQLVRWGNLQPYAWLDSELWKQVCAHARDPACRTSLPGNWSGRVARLTEATFADAVEEPSKCSLVFTFARWCGSVAQFLSNVNLAEVADELSAYADGNVVVGAFESSKEKLHKKIAELIPGGIHWLNLVLYPESRSKTTGAVRFGDWFGVRAEGASSADVVEFAKSQCKGKRAREEGGALSRALVPHSASSPATALEWSAASLLGTASAEEPQLPVSAPCALCVIGHSHACARCSSRVLVRYGTLLEEHISVAKFIKSHIHRTYSS